MKIELDTLYVSTVAAALSKQDELNKTLHPEWYTQGWPYYRAVWTEMAEAIGHLNWLWWKSHSYGAPLTAEEQGQVHMELVDILHFGMSMNLLDVRIPPASRIPSYASQYINAFSNSNTISHFSDLADCMEYFIAKTIIKKDFDILFFAKVCEIAELPLTKLLALYFAKQELNTFRWANGYKEKTYRKLWPASGERLGFVEDNVHLSEIVSNILSGLSEEDVLLQIQNNYFATFVRLNLSRRYLGGADFV